MIHFLSIFLQPFELLYVYTSVNTDAHNSTSLTASFSGDAKPGVSASKLPTELAACHAMIVELLECLAERERNNQRLQHQLQSLLRKLYGRSSEKIGDSDLALFREIMDKLQPRPEPVPETEVQSSNTVPAIAEKSKNHHKHGRRKAAEDLPRQEIIHDLPEEQKPCPCCGQIRCVIGQDVSEQYDYVPAKIMVLRHIQLKYACQACDQKAQGAQITLAEKPLSPVEKGLAAPGLLAHVVVSKYCDHLPMYRMESILERSGIRLSRSTLCDWAAQVAVSLKPVYERMRECVLESAVMHTDDTPVDALEPGTGGKHTGRFWVYVGDPQPPYCLFDYTASRSRDGPVQFLGNWSGYLQADAFSGYDGIYLGQSGGKVVEVACWAHTRRKFYEARNSDMQASTEALAHIRLLYDVEDQAREKRLEDSQRAPLRQTLAKPRLEAFKQWLLAIKKENGGHVLPKSPMGEAVTYALNQWDALCVYITDGRLAIDNNVAENTLRRITIGRKNWLFVGSDNGGQTAAILYSLISTCKRHKIEPWAYLRDVLARIPQQPADKLDELLPDQWKAEQSQKQNHNPTTSQHIGMVPSAPAKDAA